MKSHSITLDVPQEIYEQLEQISSASGMRIEDVFIQTMRGGMPPSLRSVAPSLHSQLLDLNKLDDRQLWDVIADKTPQVTVPSPEMNPEDLITMRRAYAFSLLKWRGHPMPSPHEMNL